DGSRARPDRARHGPDRGAGRGASAGRARGPAGARGDAAAEQGRDAGGGEEAMRFPVILRSGATRDPFSSRTSASKGSLPIALLGVGMTLMLVFASALSAQAMDPPPSGLVGANETPALLKGIGIDQKLDAPLPLSLAFRDEAGREVRLGDFFGRRP